MSVISSEGYAYALPSNRLVSFIKNVASVMLFSQNGDIGKIKNEI